MKREDLGPLLAAARKDAHLTQTDLGRKLGFSQRTVVYWEMDRRRPNAAQARQIADFFDALGSSWTARLARALGVAPRAAAAAPAGALRDRVDLAVLRAAEELDVSPLQVRRVAGALLEKLRGAGVSVDDLAPLLVPPKRSA